MSEASEMQVFFSSDEAYASHLGTVLASIVHNADPQDRIAFHLLDCGLSPQSRLALSRLVEKRGFSVRFREPDPGISRFTGLVSNPQPDNTLPDLTYYRLMVGSLFPDLQRILYLDCDLVVRKSLGPLWETSLEGKVMGAVEDQGTSEKLAREKSLLGADPYLNSGMLLLDLEAWRSSEAEKRFIEFTRTRPDIPRCWHDQSLLNAVLKQEVLFLDRTWNAMVSNPVGLPRDPAIVHYTYSKPWNYTYRHVLYAEDYWKYRRLTPWGREKDLDGIKRGFRIKRAKEAWRHPKQVIRAILGLGTWETALPTGLAG